MISLSRHRALRQASDTMVKPRRVNRISRNTTQAAANPFLGVRRENPCLGKTATMNSSALSSLVQTSGATFNCGFCAISHGSCPRCRAEACFKGGNNCLLRAVARSQHCREPQSCHRHKRGGMPVTNALLGYLHQSLVCGVASLITFLSYRSASLFTYLSIFLDTSFEMKLQAVLVTLGAGVAFSGESPTGRITEWASSVAYFDALISTTRRFRASGEGLLRHRRRDAAYRGCRCRR